MFQRCSESYDTSSRQNKSNVLTCCHQSCMFLRVNRKMTSIKSERNTGLIGSLHITKYSIPQAAYPQPAFIIYFGDTSVIDWLWLPSYPHLPRIRRRTRWRNSTRQRERCTSPSLIGQRTLESCGLLSRSPRASLLSISAMRYPGSTSLE